MLRVQQSVSPNKYLDSRNEIIVLRGEMADRDLGLFLAENPEAL